MFEDPRNGEWDWMGEHLAALNAAKENEPIIGGAGVAGGAVETDNGLCDDNASLFSSSSIEEIGDGKVAEAGSGE